MPPLDTDKDLVALFRAQVQRTPAAVAVEDGTTTWTYDELDRAVERLARRLRRDYGVGRDSLVGVLMGHRASYVAACLAAMAAGGAFLVLETAYPAGQLADVIGDAQPAVVLASAEFADRVPSSAACIVIGDALNDGYDENDNDDDTNLPPLPSDTDLDRLAFVSYSSGSTGLPKGIANPHSAPVRSYALRFRVSDLGPGDRVACNVFFVWEILRPLLRGATVVAVPDAISYDPVALVEFLARHAITETLMTPTLLATVLARYDGSGAGTLAARLPALATLWLNGEVVSVDLARRAAAALPPRVRLLNCYSASETHEIACGDLRALLARTPVAAAPLATAAAGPSCDDDTTAGVCPVGAPLDPDHVYVVDEAGQRVAVGVTGELYVGGDLLARGYINRPETTAEVFLPDVFANDGTDTGRRRLMYRTGDRARMLPSGDLEISGRVGGMIKIRGYTVHPAAVESAVVRHLAVRSCVIVADGDGLARQLVAYVVRDTEGEGDDRRLSLAINAHGHSPLARRLLAAHLAHYMIPVHWIALDRLPTHEVSGKVDLRALPAPQRGESSLPPTEATTTTQTPIRSPTPLAASSSNATTPPLDSDDSRKRVEMNDIKPHWAACLGLDDTAAATALADGAAYDFFDLGGHSLALAELASRLSAAHGVTVPLLELARTPTLAGHAAAVAAAVAAEQAGQQLAATVDTRLLRGMLAADCVLEEEAPEAKIQSVPPRVPRISEADTIFLTGATGFLGAFLLDTLLARSKSDAKVLCLVRAASPAAGLARLRRHLLGLGLWRDGLAERIEIVVGDLGRPRLGLVSAAWDSLVARVRAIVHAGAYVNLVYPYEALRDANVGGTRAILRLATEASSRSASLVPVHYISTNGVLPPSPSATGWSEDAAVLATVDDVVGGNNGIPDGYGQSKWVAEKLVLEAIHRGLPARIYRPGTLGGHSHTGATNPRDVVTALLVEALRLGAAPTKPSSSAWRLELTPVDHVSDAIVALADTADPTNNSSPSQTIFHVGSPVAVSAADVFSQLGALGYATESIDYDTWVARWMASRAAEGHSEGEDKDDDPTPSVVLQSGVPPEDVLARPILLEGTRTQAFLARGAGGSGGSSSGEGKSANGASGPSLLDRDLLTTYTRHFYARGWLDKGPTTTTSAKTAAAPHRPLAGKVAVVTGASSGIGAAVAEALACEGVHVALAARRVDALQALQGRLAAAHPDVRVLAQATDVTDAAQVQALVTAAGEQLGSSDGGIDILVSCAGVMYFTMMASVRTDEWERTVDVNCKGLLHCLAATVPQMLARKTSDEAHPVHGIGHIVAISSDAGRKTFPGLGVYSGSKFFVEAVLQSLRLETAGTGLRVTSVQPGNTATELLGLSTDPEAMAAYGTPTGARVLDAADVAGAVVYALRQPAHVAVNEVLIEPRDEPI